MSSNLATATHSLWRLPHSVILKPKARGWSCVRHTAVRLSEAVVSRHADVVRLPRHQPRDGFHVGAARGVERAELGGGAAPSSRTVPVRCRRLLVFRVTLSEEQGVPGLDVAAGGHAVVAHVHKRTDNSGSRAQVPNSQHSLALEGRVQRRRLPHHQRRHVVAHRGGVVGAPQPAAVQGDQGQRPREGGPFEHHHVSNPAVFPVPAAEPLRHHQPARFVAHFRHALQVQFPRHPHVGARPHAHQRTGHRTRRRVPRQGSRQAPALVGFGRQTRLVRVEPHSERAPQPPAGRPQLQLLLLKPARAVDRSGRRHGRGAGTS
mmetsp:Transcript_53794/g.108085  ORF Transcript_53794/g.108085 Transcript_53794/m.108085 type:complete len:319 (+) Transcript_53794:107-1063(+)